MKTFRITHSPKINPYFGTDNARHWWPLPSKTWVDAPNKREARRIFRQTHSVKESHIEEIVEQKQNPMDVIHLFEDGTQ